MIEKVLNFYMTNNGQGLFEGKSNGFPRIINCNKDTCSYSGGAETGFAEEYRKLKSAIEKAKKDLFGRQNFKIDHHTGLNEIVSHEQLQQILDSEFLFSALCDAMKALNTTAEDICMHFLKNITSCYIMDPSILISKSAGLYAGLFELLLEQLSEKKRIGI